MTDLTKLADALADAMDVPLDEAQREVEDSGIERELAIAKHQLCENCGMFRCEHTPSEWEDCPF